MDPYARCAPACSVLAPQLLLTYSRCAARARVACSRRPTVVGIPICLSVLQEIRRDAFWLQRRVSSAFGSMDAAEAQQLAEKIFRTLEVTMEAVFASALPSFMCHMQWCLRPTSGRCPSMQQHLSAER